MIANIKLTYLCLYSDAYKAYKRKIFELLIIEKYYYIRDANRNALLTES